jgi:cell cycle checkpoint protein
VGFQNNGSEISTSVAVPIARNDLILHQLPYMTMILEKGVGSRSAQKITSPETRGPNYRLQQDAQYARGSSASGFRKLGRETQSIQLEWQALAVSQADDGQLFLEDDDIVDDP